MNRIHYSSAVLCSCPILSGDAHVQTRWWWGDLADSNVTSELKTKTRMTTFRLLLMRRHWLVTWKDRTARNSSRGNDATGVCFQLQAMYEHIDSNVSLDLRRNTVGQESILLWAWTEKDQSILLNLHLKLTTTIIYWKWQSGKITTNRTFSYIWFLLFHKMSFTRG